MKKLKYLFILVFLITLSCSQKGAGTSSVKLNVGNLIAAGSTSSLNGGVVVMGRMLDESESFRSAVNTGSQELSLDLKKGDWEFTAIAWDGTSPMTGKVRCSYSGPISLQNNQSEISFNLKREICKGIVTKKEEVKFSDDAYMIDDGFGSINQFKPIKLETCNVVGSGICDVPTGITQSFRIFIPGEFKSNGNTRLLPGIASRCIAIGTPGDLVLPVGTNSNSFVKYTIEAYALPGCSGQSIFYPFKDKSPYVGLNEGLIRTSIREDLNNTFIYIEHNPSTVNEYNVGNNAFFGFAKDGDLSPVSTVHTIDSRDYGKVVKIDGPDPRKITINTDTHNFEAYDEVLWYVNYEKSTQGCSGGETDPKKRFTTGMYGVALIKSVAAPVASKTVIELHRNFNEVKSLSSENRILNIPTEGELALSSTCSIQIVKMRQHGNVTMYNNSTSKITALPFNTSVETGGIVAFKVLNTFYVTHLDQYIDVSGLGLPYISQYSQEDCVVNEKRCSFFGKGDGGYRGGGLIFANINNLKYTHGATTDFYLKANAETMSGTNLGGSINMNIKNIFSDTYNLTLQTYARNANTSNDGESTIRYCHKDPNVNHNDNNNGQAFKYKFENVSEFCN